MNVIRSRLAAVVVLLFATSIAAGQKCTNLAGLTINASDTVPPKFMVSAADCCNACIHAGTACHAAVFENYYCHLKSGTKPLVEKSGASVLVLAADTTTTSDVPGTTSIITVAPSAVPAVTTPPPPKPTGTVTIVREITCRYSGHCNESNDNSCYTTVFYNDTCQKDKKYVCGEYHIHKEKWSEDGCRGVIIKTTDEDENVCENVDYEYYGHYCDIQPAPEVGLPVVRSACRYNCGGGSGDECSIANFTTGACLQSNPFSNLPGESVIAWCFSTYVVYSAYGSIDCTGPIAASRAEPLGCWAQGYTQMQNICG